MISAAQKAHILPVHPFPARMVPSIVWDVLPRAGGPLNILVCAGLRGHHTIGCDTDPLALLIARAWCTDAEPQSLKLRAEHVLERARILSESMTPNPSYPRSIDDGTRQFIDFWFDPQSCRELNSLASCISRVRSQTERTLLWCAFSRMIITKTFGVSLAMDVPHSRPHKVYDVAPVRPFDIFLQAVSRVTSRCPFSEKANEFPSADIRYGDARLIPVESASVDMVITSPPT